MSDAHKKCNKCLQVKPLEAFHRDKCGTLGRKSFCKICANAASKKWRDANPDKVREMAASWNARNPGRADVARKLWRDANQEHVKSVRQAYSRRNAQALLVKNREWKARNPDRYRELNANAKTRNKERNKLLRQEWRKENKHIEAAQSSKRRAYRKKATPSWANEFIIGEFFELAALRTKATGIEFQVDHIVPLKSDRVCGLHVEHNLQIISKRENVRKRNRYWPDMPELITGRL